jgi:RimJ/RimL family protein N-acetyltransferase
MEFERTADLGLVRQIICHPKLYGWLTDDFSPRSEDYTPPDAPGVQYLVARDNGELLGLWVLVWHSPIAVEVHTCLLPTAWGERAAIAAKECARWIFFHTAAQRIFTSVPAYNRLALRFALQAGMSVFGRHPKSFQKKGKLHDQILLGLSREEICQQ